VTFRSRLEAKWAAFFDLCGWRWLYEPLDYKQYEPDFIMQFHMPLLIEVKPCLEIDECVQHQKRIEESGWPGEALIVGAAIFGDGSPTLGRNESMTAVLGWLAEREQNNYWDWDMANFHKCAACGKLSFHHDSGGWKCRVCGAYEGNKFVVPKNFGFAWNLFAEASRQVQWKGVDA
jgi:hypothetical protein